MRVVLDTNVLVSGIFFSGPPAKILAAWADGRFEMVASVEILAEYRRVGENGRMQVPVVLSSGEDGWIVASCPLIPGCISQGRTREEALENIQEAIALCLESAGEEGWRIPDQYEVTQVAVSAGGA